MRPSLALPGRGSLILALSVVASALASDLPAPNPTPAVSEALPRLLLPIETSAPFTPAVGPRRAPAPERLVRLNPDLAPNLGDWLRPGRHLRLDLLENQDVTVEPTRITIGLDGAVEITGTLVGFPGSAVQLVLAGREFSGLAQVPGLGSFQWLPGVEDLCRVTRLPEAQPGWCATPEPSPAATQETHADQRSGVARLAAGDGQWDPATPPTEIDMMILYTPRALATHGDEAALRRGIRKMMDDATRSYTNSLIGVRLNPVFIGLHPTWVESGNMLTDFNAMFADARITDWRNAYKADLVCMVIESDANDYGGAATLLSVPAGDPNRSMAIMRRGVFIGNPRWAEHASLTLTHEVGHILGAGHDREHGYPSAWQGNPAAFPFSNGYRFEASGVTYRTAMAYDPGIQLGLFSNPNLTFDGVPLGVPVGQPGDADNAQTLNRIAPKVANYRVALSRMGFVETELRVGEGDGSVTVQLQRTGDLNTSTRVTVSFDTTSPARPTLDYIRPANTVVLFGTNQATAELTIPIVQDDLLEGDEVMRLTLINPLGNHGLDLQSTCTITIRDDEPAFAVSSSNLALAETGGTAEVTVEFTGPLEEGVVQELALTLGQDGDTATAEADFIVTPSRLTFTAQNRQQTFQVRAVADTLDETDETARIGVGNAAVNLRLLDDDRPGSAQPVAAPNGTVIAVKALAGGGALVAGDFTEIGGIRRTAVARLRADGSLDPDFNPPELVSSPVQSFAVPPAKVLCATPLSNGGWMLGGFLGLADGRPARNLVRLQPDGRLDTSFNHPGFDSAVWTVSEQPDGHLLVGGTFDHVGQQNLRGLVRLKPDGSIDPTFRLEPGMEGIVVAAATVGVLPDGRILVGGFIGKYNGQTIRNLIRLNPDGSLDTTFPLLAGGASTMPVCLAVLPDGRAYVGGHFESIGGRPLRRVARLNADGSIDPTFRAPQPNGQVMDLQPLPNGQLLIGGAFTNLVGGSRRFAALLNEDGSLDQDFDLGRGAGDHVWCVTAGSDGSLHLGGAFRTFNDHPAPYLARLRLPSIAGAFAGMRPGTQDSLEARVRGLPGARYALESSPDLQAWEPAGSVTVPQSGTTAEIRLPGAAHHHFFRLRTLAP